MNLNQALVNKNKINNPRNALDGIRARRIMPPPSRPAPKKKTLSTVSSATKWGKSQHSVLNSSTMASAIDSLLDTESRTVLAITEGRGEARCEIGIASIDTAFPTLILCQISDAQSYINTLTKINILNPTEIIVPATFLENSTNRLIEKLKRQFPNVKIVGMPRKIFNKSNGMDRILQLCLSETNAIHVGLQHKYYALAAASALITYLQNALYVFYANNSLSVNYQESEGYAIIDVSTADRLELVSSAKPAQATRYSNLFGVLNHCYTKLGTRFLRSTILQPPCRRNLIEANILCVSELIKHPQKLFQIQVALQKITLIDQILTITSLSFCSGQSWSTKQLNYLLLLKCLIESIEPLKSILENCEQDFFKSLKNTLESDNFMIIRDEIISIIHPNAQFAKSEAGIQEKCFAIKPEINGLLDLMRQTYSERLEDMKNYVKHLGNKYNLPLSLGTNNIKGYHIIYKLNNLQKRTMKKSDLPPEFIQVNRLAASFTMKTLELVNLSTRTEDILLEVFKISNTMIGKTIGELKRFIGFFYKLCEDIGKLDMLQSLAEVSIKGKFIRPKFGDFTEISEARHPILEFLLDEKLVPNPISISDEFNTQIVTGPNGSGKSIYIRQVMLLQVMAQVGCYIPAENAIIRPMERMFARIYLEDNMEFGASAFILEMKEVKYMMTLPAKNSLFIIDELCRSTSVDEGTALAMAIIEKFSRTGAYVYVTTHYTRLAKLYDMYLNFKTWQMETISNGEEPKDLTLDYEYRLVPGVTQLKHYGVYIVKKIWPESLCNYVYEILKNIQLVKNTNQPKFPQIDEKIRIKYNFQADLKKFKSVGRLTQSNLNKLLENYCEEMKKHGVYLAGSALEKHMLAEEDLDTSSYRNISIFLQEDSDNINKLIPEIAITEIEDEENEKQNWNAESQLEFGYDNEELAVESAVDRGDEVWNDCPFNDEEMDSIIDELESSYSQNISTGEEYAFTQESLKQKENETSKNCHIFPRVTTTEREKSQDISNTEEEFTITQTQERLSQKETENNKNCHIFPIVTIIEGENCASPPSVADCSYSNKQTEVNTTRTSSPQFVPINRFSASESNSDRIPKLRQLENVPVNQYSTSRSNFQEFSKLRQLQSLPINQSSTSENNFEEISKLQSAANRSSTSESNFEELSKLRLESNTSDTARTSSKETKSSSSGLVRTKRYNKKFIPPKKLTKKEIQQEFLEQDRKIYEAASSNNPEDLSKCMSVLLKRPSVKQVQNAQYLAVGRRTDTGIEVIPATSAQNSRKQPFKRMLSSNSVDNVDMTIFSDQNAKSFEAFVNSDARDFKRFKFFNNNAAAPSFGERFSFSQSFADKPKTGFNLNLKDFNNEGRSVTFDISESKSVFNKSCTPEGYYKENKDVMENILMKYNRGNNSFFGASLERSNSRDMNNIFESYENDEFEEGYLDM